MKLLNIAIYQPRVSYYRGGGEVIPLEYARLFAEKGDNITIVTTQPIDGKLHDGFKNLLDTHENITAIYLEIPERHRSIYEVKPGTDWLRWDMEAFIMGREAYKHFIDNKYDIVSVHYQGDMMAIPEGQKSILHLHGYPSESRYDYNYWMSLPDKFVAVSEYVKEQWLKIYNFPKPIGVLTNGIDHHTYNFVEHPKTIDILYVGRLIEIKGVQYLISAVRQLLDSGFNLKVAIAGTGPYGDVLRKLVGSKGLSNTISFLGFVPDDEIVNLYRSAKVGAFPSYDREGILTTMLEAGACGIPVVTTTVASMKEYLKDGVHGFLVEPEDALSLAEALLIILTDDKLRKEMSVNIADYTKKYWSWDEKFKRVYELYEQTARNKQ